MAVKIRHNAFMELSWTINSLADKADKHVLEAFERKLTTFQDQDQGSFDVAPLKNLLKQSAYPDENSSIGDDMASLFYEWRNKNHVPLPFMLPVFMDHFGISNDHPLREAALSACIMGEIENDNHYHNNHHFREVVTSAMLLCARHVAEHPEGEDHLNHDDILLMIIAAAIHDLSHDGGTMIESEHIPSRLEKLAVKNAAPFLEMAGMGQEKLDATLVIIICTDITRDNEGRSPADMARQIYKAHKHAFDMPADIPDCLSLLQQSSKLSLMARILGEADIIPSSGTTYAVARDLTVQVATENDELRPSASMLYAFLDVICHGGYDTQAAQDLFGKNFDSILHRVKNDAANGVVYSKSTGGGGVTPNNRP